MILSMLEMTLPSIKQTDRVPGVNCATSVTALLNSGLLMGCCRRDTKALQEFPSNFKEMSHPEALLLLMSTFW